MGSGFACGKGDLPGSGLLDLQNFRLADLSAAVYSFKIHICFLAAVGQLRGIVLTST